MRHEIKTWSTACVTRDVEIVSPPPLASGHLTNIKSKFDHGLSPGSTLASPRTRHPCRTSPQPPGPSLSPQAPPETSNSGLEKISFGWDIDTPPSAAQRPVASDAGPWRHRQGRQLPSRVPWLPLARSARPPLLCRVSGSPWVRPHRPFVSKK